MSLPQEIWLLIQQELADRRDFRALYTCGQVCSSLAPMAFQQLYGIHELSPACVSETLFTLYKWAGLWRSIITSTLGETLFPYCLWVKTLNLGNLHQLLEDLGRDIEHPISVSTIRKHFFAPPLSGYHILNEAAKHTRAKAKRPKVMNLDAIITKVAEQITEFVKTSADLAERTVTLSNLEGYHLPTIHLPLWVSRLSQLRSLTIRDGSVLNATVGKAIRDNCPSFKELLCYYCQGTDLDQDLAGFLVNLEPNTLESFTIISMNDMGSQSLGTLNRHSGALKRLSLYVEPTALRALDNLSDCKALESLFLEAGHGLRGVDWEAEMPGVFEGVVGWLKACASLATLEIFNLPSAPSLLTKVLQGGAVRLTTLEARMAQTTEEFYTALFHQAGLEELTIIADEDAGGDADEARHARFVDAVCRLPGLRGLAAKNEMLALDDLVRITQTATKLEDFRFNGDDVGDEYLVALARLPQLRNLNVLASSSFSFAGLVAFIHELARHPDDPARNHDGLSILITQLGESKFSDAEEQYLAAELRDALMGRIDIGYVADPDELHESDFSD